MEALSMRQWQEKLSGPLIVHEFAFSVSLRKQNMAEPVYIAGAGRTDFRRNLRKEGRALGDLIIEASRAALSDARIDPSDVGAGVVGNFAAGLFTRQLHLGAFLTDADEAL